MITVFVPVFAYIFSCRLNKKMLPVPQKILKYRSLTGKSAEAATCLYPGADPEKMVRQHVLRKLGILYFLAAGIVCIFTIYFCFSYY